MSVKVIFTKKVFFLPRERKQKTARKKRKQRGKNRKKSSLLSRYKPSGALTVKIINTSNRFMQSKLT